MPRFTPIERRIARLLAAGLTNREIGERLDVTEQMVKHYNRSIFDKTGMGSRLEVAMWYWAHYPQELLLDTYPI